MVVGTTEGFEKRLEMIGVGYRAAVQGDLLDLQAWVFLIRLNLPIPKGLTVKVDKNTLIIISGLISILLDNLQRHVRSKRPQSHIKEREFGIRVNMYVRKLVKQLLRSND